MAYPTSPVDGQTYSNKIYNLAKGAWLDNSSSTSNTLISSWTDYAAGNYIFPSSTSAVSFVSGKCPIGAVGTNPQKGTTSEDHAQWMRDGQDMLVKMDYKQSSAGSAGSGIYLFGVPAGQTIDLTKNPVNSIVGACRSSTASDETSAYSYIGSVVVYSATALKVILTWPSNTTDIVGDLGSSSMSALSAASTVYRLNARFTCAQFSVNTTYVGMNEPFYLSNSESTVNTNGVVGKTKLGIDGSPIVANTAATYYDMTLPRALLPNETIQIQVRSKINKNWVDIERAGIKSLFVGSLHQEINASNGLHYFYGITILQNIDGRIQVCFIGNLEGGVSNWTGTTAVVVTWAQVIAAADGYDAWRVRIGQAATGAEENNFSLGKNQSYVDVASSRALNTTYTNTTSSPISVYYSDSGATPTIEAFVNGIRILSTTDSSSTNLCINFIVPVNATYKITGGNINVWTELR